MKNLKENVCLAIFAWVAISFMASMIKSGTNSCSNTYPIDYIVYTNLFCEIKP